MLNKLFLASLGLCLIFAPVQAGWLFQHNGSGALFGIGFPPGTVTMGFACGANNLLLFTGDSGRHWAPRPPAESSGNFNDILFPTDPFNAYIACDSGNVLKTTNSGRDWFKINTGTDQNLNAVDFSLPSVGYFVGNSGMVKKTTNAGDSWIDRPPPLAFDIQDVFFVSPDTGWIVGVNQNVYKTLDSANTWTLQNTGSGTLYGVCASSNLNVYAVGENNLVMKSINSGYQWYNQNSGFPPTTTIYSITFPFGDSVGFMCGSSGWIAKTTNGGVHWEATQVAPDTDFYTIFFPGGLRFGWVGGAHEAVFWTRDGGAAIEEPDFRPKTEPSFLACQPNPFRSNTLIKYNSSLAGKATLKIYDCAGGLVRNLTLDEQGMAKWDGRNESHQRVKSGVYLVQLDHGVSQHQKLIVLE